MQDLAALKIDRAAPRKKSRRRPKGNAWFWRLAFFFVVAGAIGLFYRPIFRIIDSVRLPTVQVAEVTESHPAAVGAVEGTAANGYVIAARRAALSADTPGRIVELNVTEGTVLKEGDVVARLYFDEYAAALSRAAADRLVAEADVKRAAAANRGASASVESRKGSERVAAALLNEAKAQRNLAKSRFDRTEKLAADGVASKDDLDAAEAELLGADARVESADQRLQAAKADVADSNHQADVTSAFLEVAKARVEVARFAEAQAAATLDKTFVRAPFDGVVVLKDAEVGEVVSPNSQGGSNARGSVCTMVDFDSLEVQADVPETSLSTVRLGAQARIYLDAFPERTYTGTVSRIWPTANRQKASVEVRVIFDKRDRDLRPDMGVRIVFLADDQATEIESSEPQILIAEEAVVKVDGKSGAFVLERDVVHFQPVELGDKRAGLVHAIRGLEPGQQIVLSPPPDIETGSRVRAIKN